MSNGKRGGLSFDQFPIQQLLLNCKGILYSATCVTGGGETELNCRNRISVALPESPRIPFPHDNQYFPISPDVLGLLAAQSNLISIYRNIYH
jgi:hypothetical protein